MNHLYPPITLLLIIISMPALALEHPQRASLDAHIQIVRYHEGDVVQVDSYPGVATHVVLAQDEQVQNMASGFTKGWDIFQKGNNLFIKPRSIKQGEVLLEPKAGQWDTNLAVITNKRLYSFLLRLQPAAAKDRFAPPATVAYRIAFHYPGEEEVAARYQAEDKDLRVRLNTPAIARNWDYSMQVAPDSDAIAPTMAYDDGRFTYLRFPGNREMPAVFVVAADKTESLVNTHIDPLQSDVLVIQRVVQELVLRMGNQAVGVFNDAFDPQGVPPVDGTTIHGVKRTLRTTPFADGS